MITRDYIVISFLTTLAVFIWIRDLAWVSSAEDALPIILALPLFIWLGGPWKFRNKIISLPSVGIILSAIIFLLGIIFNLTIILAFSWTAFLWFWLSTRLEEEKMPYLKRLIILPLLAFPWLILDGQAIGWWFRLSGTWVTDKIFSLLGFNVLREGTYIFVQGLPVGIGVACSGINALQSMLIAGSALAFIYLKDKWIYWLDLILLVALAWLANVIRIIIICIAAITVDAEFASGLFHTWGGWLILFLMLCLSWMIFVLEHIYYKKNL